jgi:hypothetical protein
MSEKPSNIILISYMPLLMPEGPLSDINILETMSDQTMEELENSLGDGAHVEACLWTSDKELKSPTPVFVMENAHAVAEHLEEWSENNVDKWFKLTFVEKDGKYIVILWPNLDESSARFKVRYLIEKEDFLEDAKFTHFFQPLFFISGTNNTFTDIKSKIGSKASIGFLDFKNLNVDDPLSIDSDNIKEVGPFDTNFDKFPFGYDISAFINPAFEKAKEPTSMHPWRNPDINFDDS